MYLYAPRAFEYLMTPAPIGSPDDSLRVTFFFSCVIILMVTYYLWFGIDFDHFQTCADKICIKINLNIEH